MINDINIRIVHTSEQIKQFILQNLTQHQKDIIKATIRQFGLSRQAILKHMHTLIQEDRVVAHGKTRDRYYELMPLVNYSQSIDISNGFRPEKLIQDQIRPKLRHLPANIREICEFSLSALFNNVLDHANGTHLSYKIYVTQDEVHLLINDNGVGLFHKINDAQNLQDNHLSAIEVAKGRVTSDPLNHAGEELMTVLHLFETGIIEATGLCLTFINKTSDWTLSESSQLKGTKIHLEIKTNSRRTCQEVFQRIFNREKRSARIPVKLARANGEQLNSRTQAQSLVHNIKDLGEIEFDFRQIDFIGPAFADELLRRVKEKNENIDVSWINANKMVDMLMSRAAKRFD